MRKLLYALIAMLMLFASGSSLVAAQDDGTPEDDESDVVAEGVNPVDPAIGDTVTWIDDRGNPLAAVTVTGLERGWEEYDEFSEPERGYEFVAFTIEVESLIGRGAIEVYPYGFYLQTTNGGWLSPGYASSETAEPPLLVDTVSLAKGDSEEFTIVFPVYEEDALAHLMWQPEGLYMLTLASLDGE